MTKSTSYIPIAFPDLSGNEKLYLNKALESSWISSKGEFIDKFENDFAKYIGTKYAISTSNGTVALHLALAALGIKENDEVIVPDFTFVASVNSITYTNAVPVLVDINKENWNMDIDKLIKSISPKTRAIMVVHIYGIPSDMDRIMKIADKYGLMVIEDAAEAHGAEVLVNSSWKKTGSIGNIGCFSFYGNKIITTGEGGMVITNDKVLAEIIRMLRDHGQDPKRRYYHPVIGYNYRMTNLQAAIGLAQLEKIQSFLNFKNEISLTYRKMLEGIQGISYPSISYAAKPVCWLMSILVDKPYPLSRDQLIAKLKKNNIESRPFFYPVHTLPPYKKIFSFPVSDYISKHGLNLPSGYNLNAEQIKIISDIIRNH